ncbi:MAG: hypothetical protein GY813_11295 [Halieaceae bacterium]|nr:hypothetical protein [Halieaceae bacterium]
MDIQPVTTNSLEKKTPKAAVDAVANVDVDVDESKTTIEKPASDEEAVETVIDEDKSVDIMSDSISDSMSNTTSDPVPDSVAATAQKPAATKASSSGKQACCAVLLRAWGSSRWDQHNGRR